MTAREKIVVSDLSIEVTRRCNLHCEHCLRGPAQYRSISDDILRKLFKQLDSVISLTITGGEPSLVPSRIAKVLHFAKLYKVTIENFFISTNGVETKQTPKFITEVMNLWQYCDDNEYSGIQISDTEFHKWEHDEEIDFSRHPLNIFKNTTLRGEYGNLNDSRYPVLIDQGRASESSWPTRKNSVAELELEEYADTVNVAGDSLYINVKGQLIEGCDWSYESQNKRAFGTLHDGLIIEQLLKIIKEREVKD